MDTEEKIKRLEQFSSEVRRWDKSTNRHEREELRTSINRNKNWVYQTVKEAECFKLLTITPPPAIGGIIMRNVNPFSMIFERPHNQNLIHVAIDMVDETIGVLMTPPKRQANDMVKNIPISVGNRIFLGHGRSQVWRTLKDFIQDRLKLDWDEFDREPNAGYATKERLQEMLDNSVFAFLVMTAEDEHTDGSTHARANVIHEVGLFQGKLGFSKAIILLEEGCTEFSNIVGLTQIRFPKGKVEAAFEDIRRVLEREGILKPLVV